jgi:hypothetical protein
MQIFFSFYIDQKKLALRLMEELWKYDIKTINTDLQFQLGDNIFVSKELKRITSHLDFIIVLLTKEYLEDSWLVNKELIAFRALEGSEEREKDGYVIIPVKYDDIELPGIINQKDRISFDFKNKPFDEEFNNLLGHLSKNRRAFVATPIGSDFELNYRDGIVPVIQKYNYVNIRVNDNLPSGEKISPNIISEIRRSDIVIADFTNARPNCYYEAGFAQALGKDVIMIAKKGTEIHFDLRDYQILFYDNSADLKEKLITQFELLQ